MPPADNSPAPSPQPPVPDYDALLLVSFGGPDGPDDVLPFLENVLRGRNVPRARMLEVADHYFHFGGKSPINEQNRQLIAALEAELAAHGPKLPIYCGNRNWHPLLADTLRQMAADGIRRALAFVTSAYSSYSGCRQYREDIARAQQEVGPGAPVVDKLRVFFNHPGFIEPMIERTSEAFSKIAVDRRAAAPLVFTAHSIPQAMADGCRYEVQLREACRLVAEGVGREDWQLVYQSRSGPPQQPWLEPDICDFLKNVEIETLNAENLPSALPLPPSALDLVIVPIGFTSDHLEVLYDLDTEAKQLCNEPGINMIRAGTVGTHPRFIRMIRELIVERMSGSSERPALGALGPNHDVCPDDCCLLRQSSIRT
jgi:protoporphyrin/coproporphyrin ferrochelatase